MLSALVRLGLPSYLFRVGFVVKILIHLLFVPCIPRALMIRIMFYEAKQNRYVAFPIRELFPSSATYYSHTVFSDTFSPCFQFRYQLYTLSNNNPSA